MKSLLCIIEDSSFLLEEIPEPEIGKTIYSPEDVIVEVKYCGICGTELNLWRDGFPKGILNVKQIGLGHELSGVVIATGEKASKINKGDRVVTEVSTDSCGVCKLCLSGRNNLCRFASSFMLYQGGFSKYLPLPAKNVHRIPDKISFEEAALCQPLAIAINALELRAKIKPGESVAILGPGPIGLCMVQIAKLSGAWPVAVAGLKADEKRLEMAKFLGADFVINTDEEDLFQRTKDITNFEGFDVVAEIAGSEKAVNDALDITKICGRVVLAGAGYPSVEIDASKKIMVKQLDILGCRGDPTISWIKALRLLEMGRVSLKPIVSDILPLDEWEEGFRLANSKNSLKVLLQP